MIAPEQILRSRISIGYYLDLKLNIFRILKLIPNLWLKSIFLSKFNGRKRAFVSLDIDRLISHLPTGPVIVDLGANQGWFTSRIIDTALEVHAVEPDPFVFNILRDKFSSYSNIFLYNFAVGEKNSRVRFYRAAGFSHDSVSSSISSSIFPQNKAIDTENYIDIQQVSIVDFIKKIGKPIDLVKMDIEGAEVPVLESLLESPFANEISIIVVETHEHVLPDLALRTESLRRLAARSERPIVNMDWH